MMFCILYKKSTFSSTAKIANSFQLQPDTSIHFYFVYMNTTLYRTNFSKPERAVFYRPEKCIFFLRGSNKSSLQQRTPLSFIYSQILLYILSLYTETPLYREQNSEQTSQSNLICLDNILF